MLKGSKERNEELGKAISSQGDKHTWCAPGETGFGNITTHGATSLPGSPETGDQPFWCSYPKEPSGLCCNQSKFWLDPEDAPAEILLDQEFSHSGNLRVH